VRCFESQVDRVFPVEVLFTFMAPLSFAAVRHEQIPLKFSSNTQFAKGESCLRKSIRSIRSCTVQ
jgi:hypothetical protein